MIIFFLPQFCIWKKIKVLHDWISLCKNLLRPDFTLDLLTSKLDVMLDSRHNDGNLMSVSGQITSNYFWSQKSYMSLYLRAWRWAGQSWGWRKRWMNTRTLSFFAADQQTSDTKWGFPFMFAGRYWNPDTYPLWFALIRFLGCSYGCVESINHFSPNFYYYLWAKRCNETSSAPAEPMICNPD